MSLAPGNDVGYVTECSSDCVHSKSLAPEDYMRSVEGCCR